jgi:hypothetical protein
MERALQTSFRNIGPSIVRPVIKLNVLVIGASGPMFIALDTNVRTYPGEVLAEEDNSMASISSYVAVLTDVRNYSVPRVS